MNDDPIVHIASCAFHHCILLLFDDKEVNVDHIIVSWTVDTYCAASWRIRLLQVSKDEIQPCWSFDLLDVDHAVDRKALCRLAKLGIMQKKDSCTYQIRMLPRMPKDAWYPICNMNASLFIQIWISQGERFTVMLLSTQAYGWSKAIIW